MRRVKNETNPEPWQVNASLFIIFVTLFSYLYDFSLEKPCHNLSPNWKENFLGWFFEHCRSGCRIHTGTFFNRPVVLDLTVKENSSGWKRLGYILNHIKIDVYIFRDFTTLHTKKKFVKNISWLTLGKLSKIGKKWRGLFLRPSNMIREMFLFNLW